VLSATAKCDASILDAVLNMEVGRFGLDHGEGFFASIENRVAVVRRPGAKAPFIPSFFAGLKESVCERDF